MLTIIQSDDFETEIQTPFCETKSSIQLKGFPTFYENGEYVTPINLWMNHLINVKRAKNINSNVRAISRYWRFLESHKLSWKDFPTIKNSFQFEPVTLPDEAEQADSSDEQLAQQIFSTIDNLIINESLYRQPRLSLNDLANQTGLGSKEISWAINSTTGNNFCEYINQHRVNDVKREIEQDSLQKLSLIELAFQAGFNSKSTFNAVFKKETGLTPSQFKKQTQNN